MKKLIRPNFYPGFMHIISMLTPGQRKALAAAGSIPHPLADFINDPSAESLNNCPKMIPNQLYANKKDDTSPQVHIAEYCLLFGLSEEAIMIIEDMAADDRCADNNTLLALAIYYENIDVVKKLLTYSEVAEAVTITDVLKLTQRPRSDAHTGIQFNIDEPPQTKNMKRFYSEIERLYASSSLPSESVALWRSYVSDEVYAAKNARQLSYYESPTFTPDSRPGRTQRIVPIISAATISGAIEYAGGAEAIEKKSQKYTPAKGEFNFSVVSQLLTLPHMQNQFGHLSLQDVVAPSRQYRIVYLPSITQVLEAGIAANPEWINDLNKIISDIYEYSVFKCMPPLGSMNAVRFYACHEVDNLRAHYFTQPDFATDPEVIHLAAMAKLEGERSWRAHQDDTHTTHSARTTYQLAFATQNLLLLSSDGFSELSAVHQDALYANVLIALTCIDIDIPIESNFSFKLLSVIDDNGIMALLNLYDMLDAHIDNKKIIFSDFKDRYDDQEEQVAAHRELNQLAKLKLLEYNCKNGNAASVLMTIMRLAQTMRADIEENFSLDEKHLIFLAKKFTSYHTSKPKLLPVLMIILQETSINLEKFLALYVEHAPAELSLNEDFIDDMMAKLSDESMIKQIEQSADELFTDVVTTSIQQTRSAMAALQEQQESQIATTSAPATAFSKKQ